MSTDNKSIPEHNFNDPAYNPKIWGRSAIQQARSIKLREMLIPGRESGTPRFTTEEIVIEVSKFDPTWTEELLAKGYNDKEVWKRKIIAVHRACKDMKDAGLAAGFLDRRPLVPKSKDYTPVQVEQTSKGRILLWFRNPAKVRTLTWAEREEIIANMNAVTPYENEEPTKK